MSIESRLRSVYKTGILLSRGSTQPYLWSTSSSPLLISMGLFFPPFVAAMITVDTKLSHDVCVFSNGRMWLHSVSAVCVRVRFSFQFPRFPCAQWVVVFRSQVAHSSMLMHLPAVAIVYSNKSCNSNNHRRVRTRNF